MKRFNKIALIPAAIAAGLASNAAFAGTEACFEVYDGSPADTATFYTAAECRTTAPAGVTAGPGNTLAAIDSMAVAFELTQDLSIAFNDIDGNGNVGDEKQVVYIPTTDIPGGTKIEFSLSNGALFDGNSNQIHLVKDKQLGNAAATAGFEAVASSDSTVDGESTITFLTKAGITIGAGTRLVFSRLSDEVEPVGMKLAKEECTDANSANTIFIDAISAKTDGGTGYNIEGGVTKDSTKLVDISPQFYALLGGEATEADVNAESTSSGGGTIIARTEFVYEAGNAMVTASQVAYKAEFYDRGNNLDRSVTLLPSHELDFTFVTGNVDPGSSVKMGIYNSVNFADQIAVDDGTTWGNFNTATPYETDAADLFTPNDVTETNPVTDTTDAKFNATYNEAWYVVTNTDAAKTVPMNFNYSVAVDHKLNFNDESFNSHCGDKPTTHKIGVNGAVLKVPYVVEGQGNFVRVTNEHDKEAEVTVDVFGESDNGTESTRAVTAVKLGTVPAKSSVVYFVPELIEEAEEQMNYLGADGGYAANSLGTDFKANAASGSSRHTFRFTVTAPKDLVHGVSVQRVLGGSDRVMPVLDENNWSQ